MKASRVFIVVAVGLLLQVAFARFAVGGRLAFDFVLVAVVFAAVESGAVAGMLAGTVGGLLLDVMSGVSVRGVSGLVDTLVGYATGAFGTQFFVAKPHARALIVAGATVVHGLMMAGLQGLITQTWPVVAWAAMLESVVINAIAGWIAFYVTESLPGAVARGRSRRRPSLSRRQW
jgi:rod shape-determining protein MreD